MSAETLRQAAEVLRDGGVNRLTADVGLGLADWLDAEARITKMDGSEPTDRTRESAVTVARQILGGDS